MSKPKKLTIHQTIMQLVGPIKPIGESQADEERYENLQELFKALDGVIGDIEDLAFYEKDRIEASRSKIGRACDDYRNKLTGRDG